MLKGLIWFNDINLYHQCETEARRLGLVGAADYIVYCAENYIKEKQQNKSEKNIDETKSDKISDKIIFKKSLDLWIAIKDQAVVENVTVAGLMEKICANILNPAPLNIDKPSIVSCGEPVKVDKGFTIVAPWDKNK